MTSVPRESCATFREHNERGVIKGGEVVEAVESSGAGELLLAFEIRVPAFHPQEEGFLRCLEESVGCRRRWVKPVPPA